MPHNELLPCSFTRYCSSARSTRSASDNAVCFLGQRKTSRTSELGKEAGGAVNGARRSPRSPTGSSCWPQPGKKHGMWSRQWPGLDAICVSCETSPWESLQPTMFGCCDSVSKVNSRRDLDHVWTRLDGVTCTARVSFRCIRFGQYLCFCFLFYICFIYSGPWLAAGA